MVRGNSLVHCGLVLLSLWLCIQSMPINVDRSKEKPPVQELEPPQSAETGLHYDRYLREQGKLAKELNFVQHNFRTKLDELKREEMNRLRMLIKVKHDIQGGSGRTVDHQSLLKQFEHLSHQNPNTFEVEDLDQLIQSATKDLENFDKDRHDEFKNYELTKEHDRREHTNGDSFFDESELEALFTKELEKVYNPENEEDDMVEMEEERLRMREHVMNEVDTNKDRLVSMIEFMAATQKEEFLEKDELWIRTRSTQRRMREYEQHLVNEENDIHQKSVELQKQREELERKQEELSAQKIGLQQAVEEMERIKGDVKHPGAVSAGVAAGGVPVVPGNSRPLPPDVPALKRSAMYPPPVTGGYLLDPSQQQIRASSSGCTKKARDCRVLRSPGGGSNTLCS
ncbi:hypothetical protein F7725_023247 [Dissostichus mawsoni]|uniref:NUCB1-like N-terminal domain-containing protein n=1 Tax=Dissostichus mawsoni TaxID=36200 RepID=A0A7J5Z051_DISMA|nr:hypothetical protein F7725_023247 [Dissostichus mawsoni]